MDPRRITYSVLHAGIPLGTIDLKVTDEGSVGLLVPRQPVSTVVQELQDAWTTIETLPDLPKYSGGPGRLSSKSASEARARIAVIAAALTLRDSIGREHNPARMEYIHTSGGAEPALLFHVSFETDATRVSAPVPNPPIVNQAGATEGPQ